MSLREHNWAIRCLWPHHNHTLWSKIVVFELIPVFQARRREQSRRRRPCWRRWARWRTSSPLWDSAGGRGDPRTPSPWKSCTGWAPSAALSRAYCVIVNADQLQWWVPVHIFHCSPILRSCKNHWNVSPWTLMTSSSSLLLIVKVISSLLYCIVAVIMQNSPMWDSSRLLLLNKVEQEQMTGWSTAGDCLQADRQLDS